MDCGQDDLKNHAEYLTHNIYQIYVKRHNGNKTLRSEASGGEPETVQGECREMTFATVCIRPNTNTNNLHFHGSLLASTVP